MKPGRARAAQIQRRTRSRVRRDSRAAPEAARRETRPRDLSHCFVLHPGCMLWLTVWDSTEANVVVDRHRGAIPDPILGSLGSDDDRFGPARRRRLASSSSGSLALSLLSASVHSKAPTEYHLLARTRSPHVHAHNPPRVDRGQSTALGFTLIRRPLSRCRSVSHCSGRAASLKMGARPHPFREGNYAPVREERALEPCLCEGQLPLELAGGCVPFPSPLSFTIRVR